MQDYIQDLPHVHAQDQEIYKAFLLERDRQKNGIEIIASENYVSPAVLEACWSIFTNKYSEGYPGKRYYGGNQYIDIVENLAIDRLKKLFNVKFANVQPHSGSSANLAVYLSLLQPHDTVLGMALSSWWHLTHGHKVNFSGMIYNAVQYGTNAEWLIEYDEVERLALEHNPKMIICWFSAYPRNLNYQKFRAIADKVWAYLFADISHIAGMITGWMLENPCSVCDVVMTTTHKTLRWPRWAVIMTNNEELAKKIDKTIFPGCQWWPLDHVIMWKAIAFGEALKPEFKTYCEQVLKNAKIFEKFFTENGVKMTTGGTENHLLVLDMRSLWIDGTIAEKTLEECEISCNKNTVPWDTSPFKPSWIRIWSPALTTRWLKEDDILKVSNLILTALKNHDNAEIKLQVKSDVHEMMSKFPIFAW